MSEHYAGWEVQCKSDRNGYQCQELLLAIRTPSNGCQGVQNQSGPAAVGGGGVCVCVCVCGGGGGGGAHPGPSPPPYKGWSLSKSIQMLTVTVNTVSNHFIAITHSGQVTSSRCRDGGCGLSITYLICDADSAPLSHSLEGILEEPLWKLNSTSNSL